MKPTRGAQWGLIFNSLWYHAELQRLDAVIYPSKFPNAD